MSPSIPIMAAVSSNVILVFNLMVGQCIVQGFTAPIEKTVGLLGTLSYKQIIHFVVHLLVGQEMRQRVFRVFIAGTEYAKIGKHIERPKPDEHAVATTHGKP